MAEIGHLLAFLAFASALSQVWFGFTGGGETVKRAAVGTFALTVAAFLLLIVGFVTLDFSMELVAKHSHSAKPLLYRISGAWGNHEGSMLMWCVIMAGYGGVAALTMRADALKERALGVQGALTAASMAYLLFASSPFARLDPAPLDGSGLNPLLQDPALAAHPPFLYLGYVGFSFVFSLAAAGLMLGVIDRDWAKRTRPWALAAWSALTVGIAIGSIWAYYELGWGGWWFWDPVENASFMPWLVGAALVHSLIVTHKRGGMAAWTVFLAVLAFLLSLLGAFLVRSGVLTSVHAFAVDPQRGMLLLSGLAVAGGVAFGLYAWRAPLLKSGEPFDPVSREGALIFNNLCLAVAAGSVMFGTLLPLAAQIWGLTISVGEPWFEFALGPMLGALFLILPMAQGSTWARTEPAPILKRLIVAAVLAVGAGVLAFVLYRQSPWLAPGLAVGVWLVAGVVTDVARRVGPGGISRLFKLSSAVWGMTIAHLGLGVFVIGAVGEHAGRFEQTFVAEPGDEFTFRGMQFRFEGAKAAEGPNYTADQATIEWIRDGGVVTLRPERRLYPASGTPTTEVAIRKTIAGDVYVALGDPIRDRPGAWSMRVSHHPMIDWVFGGALLIAVGGFVSLFSLRRRATREASETETGDRAQQGSPGAAAETPLGQSAGQAGGQPATREVST
ncbi:heme lyase CcmF/NrfE family subunit [bacterium]|nr:heme lyase CcmF/NrfE family subunit [bacterium]